MEGQPSPGIGTLALLPFAGQLAALFSDLRVQGVAFRHYAKSKARELGLAGWVKNLADGRVEAWLEGEPENVEALLAWLRRGPPSAHVESVQVEEVEPSGLGDFKVRFDA